jgi:hypothetical protein
VEFYPRAVSFVQTLLGLARYFNEMRVTLKAVNDELAKRGYGARLAKGSGYFYFLSGESADWLDRTVDAQTVGSRTLEEWIGEFERLKKLNEQVLKAPPNSQGA